MRILILGIISQNKKTMIEIVVNARVSKRIKVKCFPTDTIFILKKLVAAHIGTRPEKLVFQKSNIPYNLFN
jgi:hypothetical protein